MAANFSILPKTLKKQALLPLTLKRLNNSGKAIVLRYVNILDTTLETLKRHLNSTLNIFVEENPFHLSMFCRPS